MWDDKQNIKTKKKNEAGMWEVRTCSHLIRGG